MTLSSKDRSVPRFLRTVLQDLRFSFKLLFSNPKFAFLAVFTLGLGIGVNASVFSWIDSVLLHPYPRVDTREPALIGMVTVSGEHLVATSYVDVRD